MSDFLYSGSASAFATARRGGPTHADLARARDERAKPRPTPWRVIADMLGYPEQTLRDLIEPQPEEA